MTGTDAADGALKEKLFPPVIPDNPDPQTFELGFVLGGTVSTGAYTAGALDFLLEALEAWYAGPTPHRIVITTAGGSSGGAVCASILGLLSSRKVAHVTADPSPAGHPAPTQNPLWDLWINAFQITSLLSPGDLDPTKDADAGTGATVAPVQHVPALLNCQMIDDGARQIAAIGDTAGERLPWFAAPFRVAVTVANLRGIPYKLLNIPPLGDYSGDAYVQHDDFTWFAFPNGTAADNQRPDEFWLGPGEAPGCVGYGTLAAFATASGAMPVGLAARALSRPTGHYLYRPAVAASLDPPGYRVEWPQPDWSELPDAQAGSYAFTAVDGGTLNNDPFTLVHRAMAGLVGRNPRGKSDAKRAILMIDPLADQPQPIARTGKSLIAVIGSLVGTLVGGARYLTADMDLFARSDVFSRFQLVPSNPGRGKVGSAALAGSSLYAAAGWCARAFRVHDFLLGRSNMQAYLRGELVLAGDNPLFDQWQAGDRKDFAVDQNGARVAIDATTPKGSYFLPVIPDRTGNEQKLPDWPVGACNPDDLTQPLKQRLKAVLDRLVHDNGTGALPWIVAMFAVPGVVDFIAPKITGDFKAQLQAAGLLPPPS
jgi:hypothetical protein